MVSRLQATQSPAATATVAGMTRNTRALGETIQTNAIGGSVAVARATTSSATPRVRIREVGRLVVVTDGRLVHIGWCL